MNAKAQCVMLRSDVTCLATVAAIPFLQLTSVCTRHVIGHYCIGHYCINEYSNTYAEFHQLLLLSANTPFATESSS